MFKFAQQLLSVRGCDCSLFGCKLICFCLFRCSQALRAMHQAGLQHGDLHEGNVLYDEAVDSVYLTDFGLSRRADLYSICSGTTGAADCRRGGHARYGLTSTPYPCLQVFWRPRCWQGRMLGKGRLRIYGRRESSWRRCWPSECRCCRSIALEYKTCGTAQLCSRTWH